jgi:hypothetical protein
VDSVDETFGFLTDVITSFDEYEQRVRLREVALEALEFSILAEGFEAQLAQSLLYAAPEPVAVPLWQYGSRLTGSISIGATLLPIADALDVPYQRSVDNAGLALVWKDAFTWELFTVLSTSGSGVTTVDTATRNWATGEALVFPTRLARFVDKPKLQWLTSTVLDGRLRFMMEQT